MKIFITFVALAEVYLGIHLFAQSDDILTSTCLAVITISGITTIIGGGVFMWRRPVHGN